MIMLNGLWWEQPSTKCHQERIVQFQFAMRDESVP
jgi:hypothetical protein